MSVPAERAHLLALPLLLIDIDGVISLWNQPGQGLPSGVRTLVDGIAHTLSPSAAGRLAALGDVFTLMWCSGWEDRANDHLPGLVGLGPLPHLRFGGHPPREHWKLAAIDAFAGPDRPVAWIDDDLPPACRAWAAARPGPTLLVTTDPARGATEPDAVALRAWARAIT